MSGQGHMTTNSDAHDHRTTQVRTDTNSIGGGAQHNNFGAGDQNNNTGSGSQYNANSMSFGMTSIVYVTSISIPACRALVTLISLFVSVLLVGSTLIV